jgi:hypothetical protein
VGQWLRAFISDNVLRAREVGKGCCELGKEGKVTFLAGGKGGTGLGNGSDERFAVGEESKRTTF